MLRPKNVNKLWNTRGRQTSSIYQSEEIGLEDTDFTDRDNFKTEFDKIQTELVAKRISFRTKIYLVR